MVKKIVFIISLAFSSFSFCQNDAISHKWKFGIGGDIVRFKDSDTSFMGDKHTLQIPRVNGTYRINKNIEIDGSFSFGSLEDYSFIKNQIPYFSFDVSARYKYLKVIKKLNPYILVGASIIDASTERQISQTINVGTGLTYWVSNKFGLNAQILYKNAIDQDLLRTHTQISGGIIFGLSSSEKSGTRCYYSPEQ